MFGADMESVEDKGISEEEETETGEMGTEIVRGSQALSAPTQIDTI